MEEEAVAGPVLAVVYLPLREFSSVTKMIGAVDPSGGWTLAMSVIAAVTGIVGVVIGGCALRIELQRRRAENEPLLTVVANPTSDRSRQLAQIRVLNEGRRPVHLASWFIAGEKYSASSVVTHRLPGYPAKFPVVLREQESLDVLVDVSPFAWREMAAIGVRDRRHRGWSASDQNIRQFITTADQAAPMVNDGTEGKANPADPAEKSV